MLDEVTGLLDRVPGGRPRHVGEPVEPGDPGEDAGRGRIAQDEGDGRTTGQVPLHEPGAAAERGLDHRLVDVDAERPAHALPDQGAPDPGVDLHHLRAVGGQHELHVGEPVGVADGGEHPVEPALQRRPLRGREGDGERGDLLPEVRLRGHESTGDAQQPGATVPGERLGAVHRTAEVRLGEQPPLEVPTGRLRQRRVEFARVTDQPHVLTPGARRVLEYERQSRLLEQQPACLTVRLGDVDGPSAGEARVVQSVADGGLVPGQSQDGRIEPGQAEAFGEGGAGQGPGVGGTDQTAQPRDAPEQIGGSFHVEGVGHDHVEGAVGQPVQFVGVVGGVPGEEQQALAEPAGGADQMAEAEGQ